MSSKATIVDVARECGLSQATVARVLNGQKEIQVKEKTRKRVLSAARKIGYERNALAANFRRQKTKNIAISIADLTNPFFPELIKGVQNKIREYGYSIVQLNNEWNPKIEQDNFKYIIQSRLDGAIISPSNPRANLKILGQLPIVLLTNSNEFSGYDTIANDSKGGMILALERLFELGHRNIALFTGGSMMSAGSSWRLQTMKDFCSNRNIFFSEDLCIKCDMSVSSLESFSQARAAMRKFIKKDTPATAIFASNDILALAALHVANEKGIKVPDELSIIGMDGILSGEISYPTLTTVEKNRSQIGSLAAKSLIEKIETPLEWQTKKIILPCKLIERGSSGPVREKK
jgi:LacI family transcriptional regulator